MSILSYTEICELIEAGVIEGADYACVNSASLDIHLSGVILTEDYNPNSSTLLKYINARYPLDMKRTVLTDGAYIIEPGEFILASSVEIFHLPNNISAEYKLKSSMARLGLDHLNAGWCDAGWNGSALTLELKNVTRYHNIVIEEGDKIGQMIFYKHTPVPADKSYAVRGSYNGDREVTVAKQENKQN